MASPLLNRAPCLVCLRRITQVGNASVTPFFRQMRKKSNKPNKNTGIIVRLLVDMKGYGKQGSIFRIQRGIMRNLWYPTKKAEFMTDTRMKQLGLTKDDVGQRDPMFGMQLEFEEELIDDAVEAVAGLPRGAIPLGSAAGQPALESPSPAPAVEIEHVAPNRALELLTTMIPDPIIIERHLKHLPSNTSPGNTTTQPQSKEPEQPKVLTPLERRRAKMLEAQKGPQPEKTPEEAEAERRAEEAEAERERIRAEEEAERAKEIYGSVSVRDVASYIKDKMLLDPEASRIHVQPEEISIVGLAEGVDKVEKVGSFQIEIRTHVGRDKVEPVRRTVEVVAA
ncbi:hypothetical protein KVR01_004959 [Diaporthe batatas]|uniref:uncharacterized protein n=1 Tax=Diaporthe batatas TaxID=748121 RepID=UPI001D03BDC7|nr:uncharacterized protein KVR01_004959 [Diaporthe batatas]KAG8164684.1 hypothetical protein KVR01_004959 [Diaporthe batatas]